jgi:hypothetical protein
MRPQSVSLGESDMTTTDSLTNAGAKAGLTELGALLSRSGHCRCGVGGGGGSYWPLNATAAALLLVSYPAWDALANWFDAQNSGGLRTNLTQSLNIAVSILAAIAVAVACSRA